MFGIITLFAALGLAGVAATFAIFGIVAIFAGAPIAAATMGAFIELGKLTAVSWVYRNWDIKSKLKIPGLFFVFVAMMLTSMGIFGYLSKAHVEQNANVGNNTLQIERIDQRIGRQQAVIDREQDKINSADSVIQQLDTTVQTLIEYDKISGPDGARAVREGQQAQRDALAAEVARSQSAIEDVIAELQDERLVLSQEVRELELEIGPVKYIAALIYEEPENNYEDAVRIVIILFIFVFDPMAIWLLMAANHTLMRHQHMWGDEDDPHTPEPPPAPKAKKIVPNASAEFVPSNEPKVEEKPEEEGPKQHTASRRGKFTQNDKSGLKRQKIR